MDLKLSQYFGSYSRTSIAKITLGFPETVAGTVADAADEKSVATAPDSCTEGESLTQNCSCGPRPQATEALSHRDSPRCKPEAANTIPPQAGTARPRN